MNDLEHLLLERDLHEVLCRYARLCDERDWSRIDAVFSDSAHAEYGGWPLRDRAAILSMLRKHLGGCGPTQHLLGNLQVDVTDSHVSSRISVRAAHRGSAELAPLYYEAIGEYHDQWELTPAGWRISFRQMHLLLETGNRAVLRPAP
ncbi:MULTISPECIES: nuclear transport factor 2 family protein [Comamonadaceae]|uniref:nuclear transport factor 2 family protein n=1 Tax=Comamonadaceae TaxID=80864 RepID=UPI00271FE6E8|nr:MULTISPECIES: nuclear transport factor 2 family protein [Comamonadaceae]MDO9143485.1 nuclear transport factor 2 family protein [Rhodoferax sp.]MDP3884968.1 nuclear transport factor 2 family protein [Hydrogenophaga sp.]